MRSVKTQNVQMRMMVRVFPGHKISASPFSRDAAHVLYESLETLNCEGSDQPTHSRSRIRDSTVKKSGQSTNEEVASLVSLKGCVGRSESLLVGIQPYRSIHRVALI